MCELDFPMESVMIALVVAANDHVKMENISKID